MTPADVDAETVLRRLRLIEDALGALGGLRGVDAERLGREPLTRAAAERLLQVVVDLTFDINGHLAVALLGRAPETGRQSFLDLGEAGVLTLDHAARLAPLAGLRNVLVHHYTDIRLDIVADAVVEVLDGFPAYVAAVARCLKDQGSAT